MFRRYFLIVSYIIMLLSTSCTWEQLIPLSPTVTPALKIATPTQSQATKTPLASSTLPPTEVPQPEESQAIIVGSKASTEQRLLGQLLLIGLQEKGYEVVDRTGLEETSDVRKALEEGELDIYWEYVGKALQEIHQQPESNDPQASLMQIRALDEPQGLVWLDSASFNSKHTLLILSSNTEQGITTLSELADFMNNQAELTICMSAEFLFEMDGLEGLQKQYGFEFKEENIFLMESDQIYDQIRQGKCDVAEGRITDGRIKAWELYPLVDSRAFFPAYNAAPVIRQAVLAQHPKLERELTDWLDEVGPRLDDSTMSFLNACVDIGADNRPYSGDEQSPQEVARAFLDGTLELCLPDKIVVSSHNMAPESVWVGKMYLLLLSKLGYQVEDKTALGAPNEMREAMLAEEIDLYMEAVSFGLMLFHGIPPAAFPTEPIRAWKLVQSLDRPQNIIWLEPAENIKFSSMLVVRQETFEQGIQTIPDLAAFMNANDSPFTLCTNASVAQRPDGIPGVESFYGFKFKKKKIIITDNLTSESYQNLRAGKCDVSHGLTTDHLEPWGFKQLEDPEHFFPPFTPAAIVRQEILDEYPKLADVVRGISAYLNDKAISEFNRLLEVGRDGVPDSGDEESIETIARLALCDAGLLNHSDDCPEPSTLGFSTAEEEEPEELPEATPTPEIAPQARCEDIVVNGSFETDETWYMPTTARTGRYNNELAHSGERSLLLGSMSQGDSFISHSVGRQELSIPADVLTATLSYWYYPISKDVNRNDVQGVVLYNRGLSFVRRKLQEEKSNEQAWILQNYDLSALIGDTVHLYFYVSTDGDGQPSAMYVDDVRLQVCYAAE